MFDLDTSVAEWKDHLRARGGVSESDLEELESHLREETAALTGRGLDPDEAFLIAVKRLGTADALAGEFAKVNAQELWKQLLFLPEDHEAKAAKRREVTLVVALALLAGLLGKLPELLGVPFGRGTELWYFRNVSFLVLPSVLLYWSWKRRLGPRVPLLVGAALVLAFVASLLYPYTGTRHTELLTGIHLPIVLWLLAGIVYAGARWRSAEGRMDFLRLTGEAFIYSVLIGCGGIVVVAFTVAIFSAVGIDTERFATQYLGIIGGCAIPVVAVFLVEAKRSIVENLAPVLARIFSPLVFLVLLAFLVAMPLTGKGPLDEREFLIAFDLMLALVLGLVAYLISAHRESGRPVASDFLVVALIAVALIADGVALGAMVSRLSSFGVSPNRLAALGENIALLVNLAGLAALSLRFILGKGSFAALVRWQTAYLPVYAVWALFVALGFPPMFGFR